MNEPRDVVIVEGRVIGLSIAMAFARSTPTHLLGCG
jgi:hypothetical protein